MKAHILTVVVIDFNELGAEGVVEDLQSTNFANDCIRPKVGKVETFELGEWEDGHPLNQSDTDQLKWLRENPYLNGKRSAAMCGSFVSALRSENGNICMRCGWDHRDEREKKVVGEIRDLTRRNATAGVRLDYHDGLANRRDALEDLRLLLKRLDRIEGRTS
jgi:hypothetical protein